ncbi:MAG TPA: adenylate/guanylate cyclase domain-containing protein [Anaerolineales bacterium]|nr:adenylate/guanylate cyclase domain-containing protein [Anaerolineales bacterium]
MSKERTVEEEWYEVLTKGEPINPHMYHFFGLLPSNPRCKLCAAPFKSWGGSLMRMIGREQSKFNPRFCVPCEKFERPGGAEIVLTMLFADVRGSTKLAEKMSPADFSRLMNRFYSAATRVLVRSDAMVDRLLGDEAIGLFIPGFSGQEHARRAIEAAQELLKLTGHHDPKGAWIPVGVGIHTGLAYVGVVGEEDGPLDFTALGDNVNIAARLASKAAPGEILISDAAYAHSALDLGNLEHRQLMLKGKSEATGVYVLDVGKGRDGNER